MASETIRARLHRQLAPEAWPGTGLSPLNLLLCAFILLATLLGILETEPDIRNGREGWFRAAEASLGLVFLIEFGARLWTAADGIGRGRFLRLPATWVDIVVLVITFVPLAGLNGQALRLVRLLRILRIAKLGRMSRTFRQLVAAIASRRYELILTMLLAIGLVLAGASLLYWAEGEVQPDKFGSIPRALWWAVVTLTTIGYGDVYPITPLGKVFAGAVAFAGIGLIAMPAGILAAAFSDAMQRERAR